MNKNTQNINKPLLSFALIAAVSTAGLLIQAKPVANEPVSINITDKPYVYAQDFEIKSFGLDKKLERGAAVIYLAEQKALLQFELFVVEDRFGAHVELGPSFYIKDGHSFESFDFDNELQMLIVEKFEEQVKDYFYRRTSV